MFFINFAVEMVELVYSRIIDMDYIEENSLSIGSIYISVNREGDDEDRYIYVDYDRDVELEYAISRGCVYLRYHVYRDMMVNKSLGMYSIPIPPSIDRVAIHIYL
jgi:hypothetical protein